MSDKCPKCGAEIHTQLIGERSFRCGMFQLQCNGVWEKSCDGDICLRTQLAAMTAERDALAGELAEAKEHIEYLIKQRQWCEG